MNFSPQLQIKISFLVFIAFILLMIIFVFLPLISGLKAKAIDLNKKAVDFAKIEKEIKALETFEQLKQEKDEILTALENSFLNFSAPVAFFEFLEQRAIINRLQIDILPHLVDKSPLEKEDSTFASLNFRVTGVCLFEDCQRFIQEIERGPYLLETESLSLQKLTEKMILPESFSPIKNGLLLEAVFKVFAKEKK